MSQRIRGAMFGPWPGAVAACISPCACKLRCRRRRIGLLAQMSMRAARDPILVTCAVISTVCLVRLVHLALNLDIAVVDSIGGR
jgi:hypothetical protein